MATRSQHESKTKLVNAGAYVMSAKGHAAATVDDICHAAGVTKRSFCGDTWSYT
jgi:TetR/AcrR family transcriptional regulator, transcriptional repressor for nem operon